MSASSTATFHVLVLAKAPVPGRVKTRLGADIGMSEAASLAAAALADSLRAGADAVGAETGRCHIALDGVLDDAVDGDTLTGLLTGWSIRPQVEGALGARIAAAVAAVPGPVVQIGMDTPQVDADLLARAAAGLDLADAVLGEAEDGGWWVLGLRDPAAAAALIDVPMSTATTYVDTLAALEAAGLTVTGTTVLRDVDTVVDADQVAAAAPRTAFAARWRARDAGPIPMEVSAS